MSKHHDAVADRQVNQAYCLRWKGGRQNGPNLLQDKAAKAKMAMQNVETRTLDEQRLEYQKNRFLAMPLAGLIVWSCVGIIGATRPVSEAVWAIWIGVGSIFYLGAFISRFTGEKFFDKSRKKNTFDTLFLQTAVMAILVFSIAMPFAHADYTSIPLSVGILTGLMWVPLSWAIQHWIGIFHGVTRTLLIVAAWYAFPEHRFVVIPGIVVFMYLVTIPVLESRWRRCTDT